MKGKILFSVLLTSLTSLSYAESQPSKGAEGLIHSEFTNRCFKPKSKYVQQICTDYEIRYKLWSLMGEPVGNYVLNWKLSPMSAITIKGVPYNSFDIPEPLKKSIDGLELYIDGSANVTIPKKYSTTVNFHRFNTGVAVKANKGSSYNTPGSPNWNKTFIESKACSKTDVKYATVADAKDAFINGFTLSRLEICSGTEVYGVTYIDDAIEHLCRSEESEKYKFCPKKEKKQEKAEDKKQSDLIDDAFAKLDNKSKKKTDGGNSIDDAFSKLDDKTKGNSQIGDIDSQFEKAEVIRKENEKARIKEEQKREAERIWAEKNRINTAILTAVCNKSNCD